MEHTAYTVKEYRRFVAVSVVLINAHYSSMVSPGRQPRPLSGASVRRHPLPLAAYEKLRTKPRFLFFRLRAEH